jgi:hypothetical protein
MRVKADAPASAERRPMLSRLDPTGYSQMLKGGIVCLSGLKEILLL